MLSKMLKLDKDYLDLISILVSSSKNIMTSAINEGTINKKEVDLIVKKVI